MKKLTIFEKEYDGESVYDVDRDVSEAFLEDFNPLVKQIPSDEHGFQQGVFEVTITWRPERDDRKLIGYCEREEGFYPMYEPPRGRITTQAFMLCRYCQGVIWSTGGPREDAVCIPCREKEPDDR